MASYRFIARVNGGEGKFQTLRKTVDGALADVVIMGIKGLSAAMQKAGKTEADVVQFTFKKLGAVSTDEFALGAAKAPSKRVKKVAGATPAKK